MRPPTLKALLVFASVLTAPLYAQERPSPFGKEGSIVRMNAGPSLNSRFDETKPVLSHDGRRLYFARKRHPLNTGGIADPQDIYYADSRDGITWTMARNGGSTINTKRADNLCGITPDGRMIFFKSFEKGRGGFLIRDNEGSPEEAVGPVIENESRYLEASFSADLQVVVFTAKTRKNISYSTGTDERDIYISTRMRDGWSVPINIGPIVNSAGDEYSPFLSADLRTLYFASDGRGGYGDADLFVSKRIGQGWQTWTEPVNLGPLINTKSFDGYLSIAAETGITYIVSGEGSLGKTDLVRIELPQALRPEKMISHEFNITDHDTGAPSIAEVHIKNLSEKIIASGFTDQTGKLTLFVPAKESFEASVLRGGLKTGEAVSLSGAERVHEVKLRRAEGPMRVFFHRGSERFTDSSLYVLDSAIAVLQQHPASRIELWGHTDSMGSYRALKALSEKRVIAVRQYLLQSGISPGRIAGHGLGSALPLASNSDEETRRKNRRVEFVIREHY